MSKKGSCWIFVTQRLFPTFSQMNMSGGFVGQCFVSCDMKKLSVETILISLITSWANLISSSRGF